LPDRPEVSTEKSPAMLVAASVSTNVTAYGPPAGPVTVTSTRPAAAKAASTVAPSASKAIGSLVSELVPGGLVSVNVPPVAKPPDGVMVMVCTSSVGPPGLPGVVSTTVEEKVTKPVSKPVPSIRMIF